MERKGSGVFKMAVLISGFGALCLASAYARYWAAQKQLLYLTRRNGNEM
jgi:hypothetical protein